MIHIQQLRLLLQYKIMKILVTHSSSFDYRKELYLLIRNSDLNNEYLFILSHEADIQVFTRPLMERREINLQIAEISYPSTGQGIEMGWANVYKIPVISIYKKGSKYPGSVKLVTSEILEYSDNDEMINKLSKSIKNYEN